MDFISQIAGGFETLLSVQLMLILAIGIILGITVGAVPGFSAANATAVLLPLTIGMGVEAAMVFMAAIYCGSMYGGAIPGIIFNTPGTAGAAATIIDGYPMAQQGKGDIALGISLGASVMGGVIGVVLTTIVLKPMASLALKFGPAEMFLLAMLGISVIASVIGNDLKKGFLSGLFGLLIAAMPADPAFSQPRLTFGLIELFDEVPFIPALIGLFAIPTLVELSKKMTIAELSKEGSSQIGSYSRIIAGIKEAVIRPFNVIRSALIGFFIGAIPGTGASIAGFVSYGQAKTWSKNPELFGKGNPEGIIASEAANNGVAAGAMIPSIALGVPGSSTTAVMLAALIMHGITPGPDVVANNANLVYTLMVSMAVGTLLILPFGILFNRFASKLTTVKTGYMVPTVLLVCLIGAFATRIYTFDLILVVIFAFIGIIMDKQGYPMIPLVLGLILGPIAEDNFIRALNLSRGSYSIFFTSKIAIILWIIILSAAFMPLIVKKLNSRKSSKAI